ncbi:LysR family transcriptional regulator [Serratia marcescens]|uniref:LysR family transcriptional regulator n=1 Tax=Serratia TaxID=613 RepID=UPI000A7E4B10|nr:LysR family transcriptional regulator [Serratia marcescens]BEM64719.1 LysR family transcriptional regulator [Serratia marcescens]HBB6712933.1 LysR family transcriptional regulator [Serratia marcescens]
MKLDPRIVVQFVVIAEEASFTRAARRLHVAQPWLSGRIKRFEEQLGFSLFVRNAHGIELTSKGAALLEVAHSVELSMTATESVAAKLRRANQERFSIGMPPYSYQIASRNEIINRFSKLNPGVHVELDVGWSPSLIEKVLSGLLDLAFVPGDICNEELEVTRLCQLRIELMMSAKHPLATNKELISSDLKQYTVLVFNRALNPALFDSIFSPWEAIGVNLVPFVELNQDVLERVHSSETIVIACFDLKDDLLNKDVLIRKTIVDSSLVPFSLVRRAGWCSPECNNFLALAKDLD